jgi:hypothetical protein
MLSKILPVAVLAVTAMLTAAAIEWLPATLYFPVIEYSMPGDIQVAMLKHGEPDVPRCERSISQVAGSLRASCPTCKYVERCIRGLDAEHRKILSRAPLTTASLRTQSGSLIVTVSAKTPDLALAVCRLVATQTAAKTTDEKLLCYPPSTSR